MDTIYKRLAKWMVLIDQFREGPTTQRSTPHCERSEGTLSHLCRTTDTSITAKVGTPVLWSPLPPPDDQLPAPGLLCVRVRDPKPDFFRDRIWPKPIATTRLPATFAPKRPPARLLLAPARLLLAPAQCPPPVTSLAAPATNLHHIALPYCCCQCTATKLGQK